MIEKRFGPKQRTIEENVHLIACDTQEIARTLMRLERRTQIKEDRISFWKTAVFAIAAAIWLYLGVVGALAIGNGYLG